MNSLLASDRPNRARALELIAGADVANRPHGEVANRPHGEAEHVAGPLAAAVGAAVERAVGYAGNGGVLEANIDLEHVTPGSRTRASLRLRYGLREAELAAKDEKRKAELAAKDEFDRLVSEGLREST